MTRLGLVCITWFMDEFEATITSLGEHAVDYIGRQNLRQLAVFGDHHNSSADIQICLAVNDWASQTAAIDKMIELRAMFISELSIQYHFIEEDNYTPTAATRSDFTYA